MDPSPDTLRALRRKRDELYQEAQANPGSEAEDMVRMLVLTGMSGMRPERFDDAGFEERRHRRHRAQRGDSAAPGPATEGTETPEEELRSEVLEKQGRLQQVAKAVEDAQVAAAAGHGMDALQVCNRIAEIVGLRPPPGYGKEE